MYGMMWPYVLLSEDQAADVTGYVHELFANAGEMFAPIVYPQYAAGAGNGLDGQTPKDPYNAVLEELIYRHFEVRQIGHETVTAFLKALSSKMNEIMPYYYKLLKSEELINPENALTSFDFTETYEETSHGETGSTSNGESGYTLTSGETLASTTKNSLTPSTAIENVETYMDNAQKVDNETSGEQTSTKTDESTVTTTGDNTKGYTKTQKGNVGARPFSDDLTSYRKTFMRISEMIIKELSQLFLNVY